MVIFWLAVVVAGVFAWNAVQIGFFNTWIMFFHLLLAVYMAIFLAPVMASDVTVAVATSWGFVFTMMCIAIATLVIGYGICYVFLSGRFYVEFPQTFDTLVAGFIGFLSGFLALSFLALALCLSPLSEVGFCQSMGLDMAEQSTNASYVYWWCDWLHMLVGAGVPRSSDEAVSILLMRATAPPPTDVAKAKPPKPRRPAPAAKPAPNQVAANPKPAAKAAEAKPPAAEAKVAAAPPAAKPVDPQRRPGESWEEEFARRHVVVDSPDNLAAAIANPQVKIIEVADAFAADKLDAKQTDPFKHWVSEGGVVWATNDALTLFGISHSKLVWWGGGLDCKASAGKSPVLAGCNKVVLNNAGGKAHALTAKGAVPLLVLEKDIPFEDKAGTACWSLVPYGKGWISDPKPVDVAQDDGGQFWLNFCQYCLGRELVAVATAKSVANVEPPAPPPAAPNDAKNANDLSGTWQASNGVKFRIYDEGDAITIDWLSGDVLRSLTGTLPRRDNDAASTVFAGKVDAVFAVDAPKKYAVTITAMVNDSRSMRVRCEDLPVWNKKGKYLGTHAGTDVWTRSEGTHK